MCVLTTNGASFTNNSGNQGVDDAEFYNPNSHIDLHMMCLLVPKHLIAPKKYTRTVPDGCIPIETTGFNFNSYATTEHLLRTARAVDSNPIIQSAAKYTQVCDIANGFKAVEDEIITYAAISATPNEQGWSYITPKHYFYGRFISACHDLEDAPEGRFLDFFYGNKPGVVFHDVINPPARLNWKFSAPTQFVKDSKIRGQIETICRIFADNVQPIPNLHTTGLNKVIEKNGVSETKAEYNKKKDDNNNLSFEIQSLQWKSVCFYMNASYNDSAWKTMNEFKEFMEKRAKDYQVSGVHTWITLGGAITTYVVKISF
jgi:hypothetical protein